MARSRHLLATASHERDVLRPGSRIPRTGSLAFTETRSDQPAILRDRPHGDRVPRASRLIPEHPASVGAAILALLILGLTGCASDRPPRLGSHTSEAPYVGVFTGEFVDGLPLYRLPSIEVVGSRRRVTPELTEPNGS